MRWVVNSGESCYDVGGLASPGFCFQGFSYRTEHTELALCCLSMHNGSKTPLDGQEKRVQPCLASIPGPHARTGVSTRGSGQFWKPRQVCSSSSLMRCNGALLQHSLDRAHSRQSTSTPETLARTQGRHSASVLESPAHSAGTRQAQHHMPVLSL